MTFTCTKCGNYSDDGDFEARICLRCIDDGAAKEQVQRKWHHIDAPTKRSLDWIEKKVYDLLWQGLTPEQVAVQCRKPLKRGWSLSGDAPDSIYEIMGRIRSKGHELPAIKSKEDEDVKYTDKQKEKALELYQQGIKLSEIAAKLKINYKTLCKWTAEYKKQKAEFEAQIEKGSNAELADDFDPYEFMSAETPPIVVNADTDIEALEEAWAEYEAKKEEPAQAATCTDSESESLGKNSDPIITEKSEVVKVLPEALPSIVFDALLEKKDALLKMIADEEQHLKSLYADLAVLDEFICREVVIDE